MFSFSNASYYLVVTTWCHRPCLLFTNTGPKSWKDTTDKVDIFEVGSDTGGTVSCVGKCMKMQKPRVKVICVELAESPVIVFWKP
jgi:cysteine synthase